MSARFAAAVDEAVRLAASNGTVLAVGQWTRRILANEGGSGEAVTERIMQNLAAKAAQRGVPCDRSSRSG